VLPRATKWQFGPSSRQWNFLIERTSSPPAF
jgi:hypothetical protein